MKALSIRQPWASLIMAGIKPVENRTWKTNFRGRIWIHAGKRYDYDGEHWIMNNFKYDPVTARVLTAARGLRGGLLGTADLVDCVTEHPSEWFVGPYGFVFTDPRQSEFRPYIGRLNFFDVAG